MSSCFSAPTRPAHLGAALRRYWTRLHANAVLVGALLLASIAPLTGTASGATHRHRLVRYRKPLLATTTLALRPPSPPDRPAAPSGSSCPAPRHLWVRLSVGAMRRTLCVALPRPRPARTAHRPRPVSAVQAATIPTLGLATVRSIIVAAAARHGVAASWLLRVAMCESGLNPGAYNAFSGASGLFQFMPSTFYGNGGRDLWSAYQQADIAATMFAAGESSAWACA